MTSPSACCDGTWMTTGTRPAFVIAETASAWAVPCTAGTFTVPWPLETASPTLVPLASFVPSGGSCATTIPFGFVESTERVVDCSPCDSSSCSAAVAVLPVSFGTVTCACPPETTAITWAPDSRPPPACGAWSITVPAGCPDGRDRLSSVNPSADALSRAWAALRPTSDGTSFVSFRSIHHRTPKRMASARKMPASTQSHHGYGRTTGGGPSTYSSSTTSRRPAGVTMVGSSSGGGGGGEGVGGAISAYLSAHNPDPNSTIGTAGFEPTTSASQTRRSTRLSYVPSRAVYARATPTPSARAAH